jgi:hypothetical protein
MHTVIAVVTKMKDKTTTALRFLKLSFIDLCHCKENILKETMPSKIENHGLRTNVVSIG